MHDPSALEAIYDTYGGGRINPEAIKTFLTQAYETWPAPAPLYVLLVGDGLPDMLIARLPVHDLDELDIVIDKIIRYETSPPAGNWAAHYLFVADNPDQAGNFAIDSNELYYVLNDNLFGHRFYYEPSLQQNQDTN